MAGAKKCKECAEVFGASVIGCLNTNNFLFFFYFSDFILFLFLFFFTFLLDNKEAHDTIVTWCDVIGLEYSGKT